MNVPLTNKHTINVCTLYYTSPFLTSFFFHFMARFVQYKVQTQIKFVHTYLGNKYISYNAVFNINMSWSNARPI